MREVLGLRPSSSTWKVVKKREGEETTQSGKTLTHHGREYCSDKAKASAFCQEYARISGRKSDKACRRLNREVRREVQWHRYPTKQEIEGEFNLKELEPKKSGGQDGGHHS